MSLFAPRLPSIPSLEEVQKSIPKIPALPDGSGRPFWSVMIPTYNRTDYLIKTLKSVLAQAPPPEEMQIQVLDNGSDKVDVEAIVREIGGDRVEFFRQQTNIGVDNFTACIQRARGKWVQILHDDDMVMPGFYEAYRKVIEQDSELVFVFGQCNTIDEADQFKAIIGPKPPTVGHRFETFIQAQSQSQLVQYVSAVVKRSAYERAGGFCKLFAHYLADWDMWLRIGMLGPVGMVPRPYALYRLHTASGTTYAKTHALDARETYFFHNINALYRNLHGDRLDGMTIRQKVAQTALFHSWYLGETGLSLARLNQARWAWMLDPRRRTGWGYMKAWLRHHWFKR